MDDIESWDESCIRKRIEAGWEENLRVEGKRSESIINQDEDAKRKPGKHVPAFANADRSHTSSFIFPGQKSCIVSSHVLKLPGFVYGVVAF